MGMFGKDGDDKAGRTADSTEERLGQWLDQTRDLVHGFFADSGLGPLGSLGSWSAPGSLGPLGSLASLGTLFGSATEAYPVPSVTQYRDCVDKAGRSVWTQDGVWRCLLKGAAPPEGAGRQFGDYTGFLEYQRELLRKREAEVDARLQSQLQSLAPPATAGAASGEQLFPGNNRPRLISEDEARGKRVVSQNEASEVVSLSDGTFEKRTQVVKYFDDGTALMKRNTENQPTSKGWFWN